MQHLTSINCYFVSLINSHKRLTQQKKQRDRERKELDALGRRPLANVRVVQRNIVYVVGLGPRFAKEEVRTLLTFFRCKPNSHVALAHSNPAFERIFWTVWENY